MSARLLCFMALSAPALAGPSILAPAAQSPPAAASVTILAASYPGAHAQVVADTIAAPIEQQLDGIDGLTRIESKSGNDGKYTAHLHFKAGTDLKAAAKLVQNRVALATPVLPDVVRVHGVSTKVAKVADDQDRVAIAVLDRRDQGWKALDRATAAIVKRLATDGAIAMPVASPGAEKQFYLDIDRDKCRALGVSLSSVYKAFQAAGLPTTNDRLKKVIVQDRVSLGNVATIQEIMGRSLIYRVNRYPAVQITGRPPEGKSAAEAAARCVELAEAELKRRTLAGFMLENLAAK